MKSSFTSMLLLLHIAYLAQGQVTYNEGLANCNRIQEEKKQNNPNGLVYVGPDCVAGSTIPEFESTSIEDKQISHETLKGKISIINFWFIACAPCVAEIPGFNAIVEKFGEEQINYIAIGRDNTSDIQTFLQKHPWQFEHIANAENIIANDFKIRWGFPTTFLLNKEGEIVLAFSGGKSDATAVQEIQDKLIPIIEKELK